MMLYLLSNLKIYTLNMNLLDDVTTIMQRKMVCLHPKDKLARAKEIFAKYQIHHIPIAVGDTLVGILSLGDILFGEHLKSEKYNEFLHNANFNLGIVDELMTEKVQTIASDQNIENAIRMLTKYNINALPVLENEKLVGLVTTFDILNSMINVTKKENKP